MNIKRTMINLLNILFYSFFLIQNIYYQLNKNKLGMKYTGTIIKIILAILFIGCLFDWQYDYFQLVRFLGMVGFAILAYKQYKKNDFYFVVWLTSAVLINPFFRITLSPE